MPLRNAVTCALTTALILSMSNIARADLPKEIRVSPTADASKKEIETYVSGLVEKIIKKDPKSEQFRDELARQSERNETQQIIPSPSFQLVYVNAVVPAIAPLLNDEDPAIRVNCAIIVTRLARSSGAGTSLQSTVGTLLNDKSTAVQIWGVKAAGALLPSLFNVNMTMQSEKLSAGIVTVVKNNPKSGPILQEAYKAFDFSGVTPAMSAPAINRATDRVNEIVAARVQQYVAGTPVEPYTDRQAVSYLSRGDVTGAVKADTTPAGKDRALKVMQNVLDLASVSGERGASLSGNERSRTLSVTDVAASSVAVLTGMNPAVQSAVKPLAAVSKDKTFASPKDAINATLTALKTLPDYKNLKNPPTITSGAATQTADK